MRLYADRVPQTPLFRVMYAKFALGLGDEVRAVQQGGPQLSFLVLAFPDQQQVLWAAATKVILFTSTSSMVVFGS